MALISMTFKIKKDILKAPVCSERKGSMIARELTLQRNWGVQSGKDYREGVWVKIVSSTCSKAHSLLT